MSTTTVLPPSPHGGGVSEESEQSNNSQTFNTGDFVLMRSKRITKQEIKRFYDLYGKTLPLETWWSYISKDYNKQIEYAKDEDDKLAYFMFHTKYIGRVKEKINSKNIFLLNPKKQTEMLAHEMYIVEWEARDKLFPGESLTRLQEHYPENLIAMTKMSIMTKEEILQDTLLSLDI